MPNGKQHNQAQPAQPFLCLGRGVVWADAASQIEEIMRVCEIFHMQNHVVDDLRQELKPVELLIAGASVPQALYRQLRDGETCQSVVAAWVSLLPLHLAVGVASEAAGIHRYHARNETVMRVDVVVVVQCILCAVHCMSYSALRSLCFSAEKT